MSHDENVDAAGNPSVPKILPKEHKTKVNQRKGHRAYVTRISRNVEAHLNNFSEELRDDLTAWRVVLVEKLDVLAKLDDDIVEYLSDEDDLETEIGRASDVRGEIQKLIVLIDAKLKSTDAASNSTENGSYIWRRRKNANLPKLTLNSLGGNHIEFQSFWDNFRVAVHENGELEQIVKFNYLKNYLHGPELSAIAGLSLTSSNYDEAVKIIQDRFGNKQVLISSNMDKLLSIPTVNSAQNVESLRDVYNKIETYARNLKSLNVDRNQYGPVLVSVVMSKLPPEIKLIVSRSMPINQEWDIELLIETLRKEIESREICHYMSLKKKCSPSNSGDAKRRNESEDDEDQFTGSTLISSFRDDNKQISCTYCRRNHASSRCDVITDINGRKAILRRKAKCFICLKSGHIARHCSSTWKCFKCRGRHHLSICDQSRNRDSVEEKQASNIKKE